MRGSTTFGLGFILFYICYIAVLTMTLPSIQPGLYTGSSLDPTAPARPTDPLSYIFNLGAQLWDSFAALMTFSVMVPWLGFLNLTFTIGAVVMLIMIIRGS